MKSETTVLMKAVARLLQPLIMLLVRSGVTYGAFCAVLKPLFAKAAYAELTAQAMTPTASAISLLSGVHRADLRKLDGDFSLALPEHPSVASQVVATWLSDPRFINAAGKPLPLHWNGQAGQFNELAEVVSRDARPKAVLEELLRLNMVSIQEGNVILAEQGATPNNSVLAMGELFADNLHDHLAASCYNWSHAPISHGDGKSMLEQAVFVDELSAESASYLEGQGKALWQECSTKLLRQARERFDHDQINTPASSRQYRVRMGVYVYSNQGREHV